MMMPIVCMLVASDTAVIRKSRFEAAVIAKDCLIALRDISSGCIPTNDEAMQYNTKIPANTLSSIIAPGNITGNQMVLVLHKIKENVPVANKNMGRD